MFFYLCSHIDIHFSVELNVALFSCCPYIKHMEEIYDTENNKQISLAPQGMGVKYQYLSYSIIDIQTASIGMTVTVNLMCVLRSVSLLLGRVSTQTDCC
mgnify:FL=1|jgi:hypothetical protein